MLERSFAGDREDGFLDALLLGGVPPGAIYCEVVRQVLVLGGLAALLAGLWVVLLDVPLTTRPAVSRWWPFRQSSGSQQ